MTDTGALEHMSLPPGKPEQRLFHRVGHDAWASLSLAGKSWSGTVRDLSLKGCLLRLDSAWQVDAQAVYTLSIHLTYAIKIDMRVRLVRQDGVLAAFHCMEIDADSIAQLKRLVELNLGDPALLERDMQMLLTDPAA